VVGVPHLVFVFWPATVFCGLSFLRYGRGCFPLATQGVLVLAKFIVVRNLIGRI